MSASVAPAASGRPRGGDGAPAVAMPPRDGSPLPFLLVRRGLPILGILAFTVLALLDARGRGWYLLGAVALLAEVWPTFRGGREYVRSRVAMLRWDGLWARAIRPLARFLGKEEAWVLAFCAWNNVRVRQTFRDRKARRPLVLLPHCIQMARCKAEVQTDIRACTECGLCPVGDLLPRLLERRWNSRIANRSHKAYREAREYAPDLIVAVSCSDRLLKGLVRLPQIPSYVIPLDLPHGMCVDTTFDVARLLAAMEALAEPGAGNVQPLRREGLA